jgi:hypothetical protein
MYRSTYSGSAFSLSCAFADFDEPVLGTSTWGYESELQVR